MMPGNPVVGGVILRRPAIQSPNYTAGSAGWAVNADGSAQFSDLTIYDPTGTGFFIEVAGTILLFNPPGLNQVTGDQGTINADEPGDLLIFSGAVNLSTATEAGVQLTSSDSPDNVSGGKSNISLIAQTVTLNTVTSSDIPHAHVTGLPLAGAATLQAVRVIAP
jgi:hypothetical protein